MRPSLSGAVSRTGVRDKGDLPLRPEIAAQTNEFKQLRNFSVNILLPNFLVDILLCDLAILPKSGYYEQKAHPSD
jgi:hypothetical protein